MGHLTMPVAICDSMASEELLPRHYQEEVFSRAQKGNIIAALDTGSGKTFISLLLIKWVASKELGLTNVVSSIPADRHPHVSPLKGKKIIFLVPQVTLVDQQGTFIQRNSPLRVVELYGALELDLGDREGWRKRWNSGDVFVMTRKP